MKTTLELPAQLVKEVKLRAVRDGRKLKDAVADLLRKGLAAEESRRPAVSKADLRKDPLTGLSVVRCPLPANPGEELRPARLSAMLLGQEIEWHRGAG
jgi:plasmid stability protein